MRLKVKAENLCKRVGGNLFTHSTSAAKFQSHIVWLNPRVVQNRGFDNIGSERSQIARIQVVPCGSRQDDVVKVKKLSLLSLRGTSNEVAEGD